MTNNNKTEDEFERLFLARELPRAVFESRSKEIHDIYFPRDQAHCKLRLRKSGDKFEITKKEPAKGDDSSHLLEYTIPLTPAEFETLRQIEGKEVRKLRYFYEADDVTYEVGVFQDALLGLVTIDVEFNSRAQMEAFSMPGWFLAEATQAGFLAGGELCGKAYADITAELQKYNYVPIL